MEMLKSAKEDPRGAPCADTECDDCINNDHCPEYKNESEAV